jgi:hypothetical protein
MLRYISRIHNLQRNIMSATETQEDSTSSANNRLVSESTISESSNN